MSILVVDDLPDFRHFMSEMLSDAGYQDVVTAESAQEAFDLLGVDAPAGRGSDIDLILMDINMPEVDGVEACRRVKGLDRLRDIPVIMITGVAAKDRLEEAFLAGATDYIVKPTSPSEILARIGSALEHRQEMERRRSDYISELEQKNRELELAFQELETKNRELEEASLAKTQILSTATHELKTPLTSIIGYVDMVLLRQERLGPLNEKQQRYLETARRNSYRLKSLVDDLLDISRIESGGLELNPTELDLFSEVEETVTGLGTQFSDGDIDLLIEIPAGLPPLMADRLRLGQVISNLLSNACKYSREGSQVRLQAENLGAFLQIQISDNGIGISPEDQSRLFTKFFRADNSSTREVSGSGLGLYITKHLIEAHGGSITAESELGKGTTFTISWPVASESPDQALA